MASQSGIEWTDATWNPVRARYRAGDGAERFGWHCEHVSEGCRNCYAESLNKRLGNGLDFKPSHRAGIDIFLDEKLLTDPLRWKRPRTVFLSSMTDVFADFVSDEMLDRMFAVMALSPEHFFRVLTKRPERMRDYVSEMSAARSTGRGDALVELARKHHPDPDALRLEGFRWPLPNVGLGVSVEDQATADERIPPLLATPAAMRFVSAEPLLGAVDLRPWLDPDAFCASCDDGEGYGNHCGRTDIPRFQQCPFNRAVQIVTEHPPFDAAGCPASVTCDVMMIDEVIVGGESGKGARPMHPDWARSLRDQCAEAGVSFFFKQWGEWHPHDHGILYTGPSNRKSEFPQKFVERDFAAPSPEAACYVMRVGKKAAGALLDGREHRDVAPQVRAHFERLAVAAPPHPSAADGGSLPLPAGERDEGEAG